MTRALGLLLVFALTPVAMLGNATLSLARAVELIEQGDSRAAKRLLKPLLKDKEYRGEALFCLGKIALSEGKYPQAVASLEQAVEHTPLNDEYVLYLCSAYAEAAKKAKPAEAEDLMKKYFVTLTLSVERMRESPKLRMLLSAYYAKTPKELGGDLERAIAEAHVLIKLDPYRGRMFTGKLLTDHGRPAEAKAEYAQILLLRPDDVAARLRLGPILQDEAEYAEAHAIYRQVLQIEPHNLVALYQLGRLAAISGQFLDEGLASLERYLADKSEPRPNPPAAAYWRMGNIAEHMRDTSRARRYYEQALAVDQKFASAETSLRQLNGLAAMNP